MIQSKSPFTNTVLKTYDPLEDHVLNGIIEKTHQAHEELKETTLLQRKVWMLRAADILESDKAIYAKMITDEMGKLYSESITEIEKCAWVCQYYANHAESMLMDEIIESDAHKSLVSYQPIGAVLAVMPWNFPFWQVFRFAAPTLMLGNSGLLKHASNVPRCALSIQDIFEKAGFPTNSLTTLLINSDQVKQVIEHEMVKAVTLTGSGPAGRAVAATAGHQLKKSVLELGGSDPYIILADADVDQAAKICAKGRMMNAGQSCIGAKRFIAVKEVYNDFLSKFRSEMESYKFGDPMMITTKLAPMSSIEAREELHSQVLRSITQGAHLLTGGYMPTEIEGAFYPATILTEVKKGNLAYSEELFGPVASVFKVDNTEEAITLANDTNFGLGAAVFTKDLSKGEYIAKYKLQAGACFVNAQVKSDPRLPFGGINQSGYGRELGQFGIREFTNTKTIYINP